MGSGLNAQLGVAAEATLGTAVAVTRFFEFLSEGLKMDIARIKSGAVGRGGGLVRSHQWAPGRKTVAGDLSLETHNVGQGLLLKHAFGGVATSQPSAVPDPTVFDHVFTLGSLAGLGLTYQAGRPDEDGTVHPFTYNGVVVTGLTLGCQLDQIGTLSLSLSGVDETTGTALAAPSYPTGLELLTFTGASLEIAGSAKDAASFSFQLDNGLKVDRGNLGSDTRSKPLGTARRAITGTIDATFLGLTAYNRFVNGTEAQIVATLEGSTISNAFTHQLKVTANVVFNGDAPTVSGPDELRQNLPFEVIDPGAGGIEVLYRTTDATP